MFHVSSYLSPFSYTSAKFNFLLKFTYLYSGYTLVSAIIVLVFWWRPRNRTNGYYAAKMLQWVHKLVSFRGFVPSECWTNFIAIILDPNWVQDWGRRDAHGSRGGRGCHEPPVLHRPDVHVRDVASLQLRRTHRQEGASLHTALRSGVLDVCHWVS